MRDGKHYAVAAMGWGTSAANCGISCFDDMTSPVFSPNCILCARHSAKKSVNIYMRG